MKVAFRIAVSIALFAIWAMTFFLLYIFGTSYLFAKGLADPEWGWPLAGIAFLACALTYTFALNRILIRLDR